MQKNKIITILMLVLVLNMGTAFYLIYSDLNVSISVIKPAIEPKINKESYFLDSNEFKVLNVELNNEGNNLFNFNSEGVNKFVIPVAFDLNTYSNYYYNFSIEVTLNDYNNASNYLRVYLATAKSSCNYNKKEINLGKIFIKDGGEKYVCAIRSFNDSDIVGPYFNKISFNINKSKNTFIIDPKDSKLIVFEINPFYKGDINLNLKAKFEPQ